MNILSAGSISLASTFKLQIINVQCTCNHVLYSYLGVEVLLVAPEGVLLFPRRELVAKMILHSAQDQGFESVRINF
jgi:hypothetical protein